MFIGDLIGKRCLLRVSTSRYGSPDVTEYKVLELSANGNWVKLANLHGNRFWKPVADVAFVDMLVDLRADRPADTPASDAARTRP